jgi:hypothetical protein
MSITKPTAVKDECRSEDPSDGDCVVPHDA